VSEDEQHELIEEQVAAEAKAPSRDADSANDASSASEESGMDVPWTAASSAAGKSRQARPSPLALCAAARCTRGAAPHLVLDRALRRSAARDASTAASAAKTLISDRALRSSVRCVEGVDRVRDAMCESWVLR
jgi:hypothetical protein